MDNKFLKVLEAIGEILEKKDQDIKYQKYEIEGLRRKLKEIENKIDNYS